MTFVIGILVLTIFEPIVLCFLTFYIYHIIKESRSKIAGVWEIFTYDVRCSFVSAFNLYVSFAWRNVLRSIVCRGPGPESSLPVPADQISARS